MTHARDDGAGGGGLAGFHAGAGERDDWHAARIHGGVVVQALVAHARRHADALAEIWELQHDADDARIERPTLFGIDGVDDAEHAADVQHLDHVAFLDGLRQVSGIAEQRLAMTERADDDVALRDLRHATARQLERVVRRLVVENFARRARRLPRKEYPWWRRATPDPGSRACVMEATLSTTTVFIAARAPL